MRIPILIHEQNARAGMANKLGARWADYIGTAYEGTGLKARRDAVIERVGLPLRPAIAQLCERLESDREGARRQAAEQLGLDANRPVVVVTGGSLGAANINRAVAASASSLLQHAQIVHLTGNGKADEVRELVSVSAGDAAVTGLDASHAGDLPFRRGHGERADGVGPAGDLRAAADR